MRCSFTRLALYLGASVVLLCLRTTHAAEFRFVHTSDTHVNPQKGDDVNAARNEKLFKEISALDPKPALAINTGDVVEVGSPMEYALLQERLKAMTVPYYHAPGNHDVRWNPLGKEGFVKGTGQPLYQHIEHGGVHFFTLDSTVLLEHWGHISQQQLDWLKVELEKIGTAAPVVIAFHHWIGRDKVQVDNERELIELVDPYNVVLWLQGHGHSDIQWDINGVPAIMQKGLYQGSYCVIDVEKDKLIVTRRSLGKPNAKPVSPSTVGAVATTQQRELIRDKSIPETEEVVWTKVGEFPLKRPEQRVLFHARQGIDPSTNAFATYVHLGAAVQSRFILVTDALYVTTMSGELVCIDVKNWRSKKPRVEYKRGEPAHVDPAWTDADIIRWRYKTGDSIFSAAHIEGGVAYIGSADHHVYAVNVNDGSMKWKYKTSGAVLAGASLAKNTVCIGSADTTIYGFDATTGTLKWTVQGGNLFQSKTATDGERFFVGGWDNYFRCIDAETGREVWKKYLGREQKMLPNFSAFAPAITSPAVALDKKLVFVSTNDGILHALDTETGEEKWKIDRKKMGYSSPLYHDGVVYGCLSDESKVFAADAATGAIKWEKETGHVVYDSGFCWANGQVIIGCVNGTVQSYDAATGERKWEYKLDHGHLLATGASDDKHFYIASMLGRVTAIPLK